MPRLSPDRLPKYRHHKATGQAVVTLDGKDHYLGKHNSAASKRAYDRLVSRWQQNGRTLPPGDNPTIVELCAAFWRHAKSHYVKNGSRTDEQASFKVCLRLLKGTYRDSPCSDFGPRDLKVIRQQMIEAGNCRSYINKQISRVKLIFKWGVSNDLAPVENYQRLMTVEGLKRGKSAAKERPPIMPVDDATVEATIEHAPDVLVAMIRLQRATGMRPDEVCMVRPMDIDRTGDVWEYRPESHKTEHHGRERVIMIGPKAQMILLPHLLREDSDYCFRSKRWRSNKKPRYSSREYRDAIHRACDRGEVSRWNPNQLRHSAATDIRRQFGLEGAQVALGHASANVTQVYAERDAGLAREVARKLG